MNIFEFDLKKSESNQDRHGINFTDAQKLWNDPDYIQVKAKSGDEVCYLIIGNIAVKYWSAIITFRADIIRIISVRRSRKTEISLYES
jgi:uncharacterized DUF497 family protein